jgi:predicted AlkP superfamily pyrophosphatase or phosphodiesterase
MAPDDRKPVLLLDVVGLTPSDLKDAPRLRRLAEEGSVAPLEAAFPAVTCTAQASLLTGLTPKDHGIVGNGWFFRDTQEPRFWVQSHALMGGEDLHATFAARRKGATTARLFLWYAMGAPADVVVTPRPQYKADGRKLPDCWTKPADLRDELQESLGPFPLFQFWGPGASAASSKWIVDAARFVRRTRRPDLTSVYVPHLDYDHQRFGPDDPRSRRAVADVDALLTPLIDETLDSGGRVIVFSEYGIERATKVVRPNRVLRERGLLSTRDEDGELLDPVASRAFALCDHQIAHVYVRNRADHAATLDALRSLDGVAAILDDDGKKREALDHERSGTFVLVAEEGAWFTYTYWLDDARAPDFARCVDIHKKPGYDPCELFVDPKIRFQKLALGRRLLQKTAGFRTLFDVVPLDASIVKGTHGRRPSNLDRGPVLISSTRTKALDPDAAFPLARVRDLVLDS